MNAILASLQEVGCDISSINAASRYANTFSNRDWTKSRFEALIKEEFFVEPATTFVKEAEMLYRYMIVEAISLAQSQPDFTGESVMKNAQAKVEQFFVNFPWSHPANRSTLSKSDFDENGNYIGPKGYDETIPVEDILITRTTVGGKTVKPKKGAKQHAAKAIFDANVGKSNKEIIALFMAQLDMSKAGATTYLYNMKKGSA